MDEHDTTSQSAASAGQPPVARLTRRLDHRVIAGVAAGLGDYFAVDPLVFRVGFVLTSLLGGVGILAYVLLWWLMPASYGPGETAAAGWHEPAGERFMRRLKESPAWVGIALLVVGFALIADHVRWWGPAIVWGAALIVLGVLLFRQDSRVRVTRAGAVPAGPMGPPTAAAPSVAPGPPAPAVTWAPAGSVAAAPSSPPRVARERSALGWITMGAILLALGALSIVDNATSITVSIGQYFALAVGVLGLGLIAGAWWGRARLLIVLGLLLVPFALAASLVDVPLQGGFGQRVVLPQTAADIHTPYRLGAGEIVLQLGGIHFQGEPATVTASVVAGRIEVDVPDNVTVEVHARTGAGDIELFGQTYDGLKTRADRTFVPLSSTGRLILDLRAGFGQIVVFREAPLPPFGQ